MGYSIFIMEQSTKRDLIEHLERNTRVLTLNLKGAIDEIDRADFVEDDYKVEAYNDYPLPIGHGQTISQPTVVAFMLSLLDPQKGDRVLDVGCGSGWTTVLLGYLVGKSGEVVGVDIIEEFVEVARNRANSYSKKAPNIAVFHSSDEDVIYSDSFDRILVSASLSDLTIVPERMVKSLKEGGTFVAPVVNDLVVLNKVGETLKERERFSNVVNFVPYITPYERSS